jgi:regulator of protease activity HflC (stomatin/prohibitin superfamily)
MHINAQIVAELDKATEPWGIKVLRYEIKNITPPQDILAAMEKQMRAEREKRAVILASEGTRDAAINNAEGQKQQVIKASEAKKQQQINEAEGAAAAILAIAGATAEGLRKVAEQIQIPGGTEAVQLRVAEQYIARFGELAKAGNTFVIPANIADLTSMFALATNILGSKQGAAGAPPAGPSAAPPARPSPQAPAPMR